MFSEMQGAARFNVSSFNNKAVFYSGDNDKNKARALAQKGLNPIDRTFAGKKLAGINERYRQRFGLLEGDRRSNKVWTLASKRYAQNARGSVKTFVCGSRPNSVFRKTELPTLLKNQKVTSINGIDRNTLAKMHKSNPDRAYRAVCLAELRQDRKAAKGNEKSLADVKASSNSKFKTVTKDT